MTRPRALNRSVIPLRLTLLGLLGLMCALKASADESMRIDVRNMAVDELLEQIDGLEAGSTDDPPDDAARPSSQDAEVTRFIPLKYAQAEALAPLIDAAAAHVDNRTNTAHRHRPRRADRPSAGAGPAT